MQPVVVDPGILPEIVDEIRSHRPDISVTHPENQSDILDVLIGERKPVVFLCSNSKWQTSYLEGLEEDDWVITRTTGYENYPVAKFRERGITFSNMPGRTVKPIVEHVFALMFSVSRRLRTYYRQQEARVWRRQPEGMTDIAGEVCTVVGVGRIGEEVARVARTFGMQVRGVKRTVEDYDGVVEDIYPADELHTAIEGARVVVLAVSLTEETHDLIGSEELCVCDDDAIIINISRGPVLNTGALVNALDHDQIRAAGIDVIDHRPPSEDWPLWDRNDVFVTPHVAGQSEKTPGRLAELFSSEYDRWHEDEPLTHRIV